MEKKKSSFAIVVAIACCLIVFGGVGIVFSTAGVFYAVVADAFGVGKGTFSIYMTIVCLVMSFSLPIMGKLAVKLDIRKLCLINALCVGASFAAFAMAKSLVVIYIAAAVQGFGVAGPMYIIIPTMISRWFNKRSGFFIGLAMAFSGIAGIVLQPAIAAIIQSSGWRTAYWVEAAVSFCFIAIPGLFMLRSRPSDIDQVPYGYEEIAENASKAAASPIQAGVALKTAMKSKTFYMFAALCGLMSFYTCVNFYWTSYAASLGYPLVLAATISSCAMYGQLVGKIGLGAISDKNLNVGLICAYGLGILGCLVILILGGKAPAFVLFACIFMYGCTHGACAVESPIIAKECFGNGKDYAQIYSNAMSFGTFCSAIGSTLFGYIVDWTGGYTTVFVIGAAFAAICYILAKTSIASSKALPREE